MGAMGWMAAVAMLCAQDPQPGDLIASAGGTDHVIKKVTFEGGGDWLRIARSGRPGLHLYLVKGAAGWTPDRKRTHELWLSPSEGGKLTRVAVSVDSTEEGRLQGTWSGTLLDARGKSVPVRGSFDAVPPGYFDVKPNRVMGSIGCMLLFVVILANVGVALWFVAVAFQESVGWGFAVLLLPFANLMFVVTHWDAAKRPFLWSLGTAAASAAVMMIVILAM